MSSTYDSFIFDSSILDKAPSFVPEPSVIAVNNKSSINRSVLSGIQIILRKPELELGKYSVRAELSYKSDPFVYTAVVPYGTSFIQVTFLSDEEGVFYLLGEDGSYLIPE